MSEDVPSAAELDALFTVANTNGRLCEGTYDGRACPRDATHWGSITFPDCHPCHLDPDAVPRDGAAFCVPHTEFAVREHARGTLRCGACGMPTATLNIKPLGGRT